MCQNYAVNIISLIQDGGTDGSISSSVRSSKDLQSSLYFQFLMQPHPLRVPVELSLHLPRAPITANLSGLTYLTVDSFFTNLLLWDLAGNTEWKTRKNPENWGKKDITTSRNRLHLFTHYQHFSRPPNSPERVRQLKLYRYQSHISIPPSKKQYNKNIWNFLT